MTHNNKWKHAALGAAGFASFTGDPHSSHHALSQANTQYAGLHSTHKNSHTGHHTANALTTHAPGMHQTYGDTNLYGGDNLYRENKIDGEGGIYGGNNLYGEKKHSKYGGEFGPHTRHVHEIPVPRTNLTPAIYRHGEAHTAYNGQRHTNDEQHRRNKGGHEDFSDHAQYSHAIGSTGRWFKPEDEIQHELTLHDRRTIDDMVENMWYATCREEYGDEMPPMVDLLDEDILKRFEQRVTLKKRIYGDTRNTQHAHAMFEYVNISFKKFKLYLKSHAGT